MLLYVLRGVPVFRKGEVTVELPRIKMLSMIDKPSGRFFLSSSGMDCDVWNFPNSKFPGL